MEALQNLARDDSGDEVILQSALLARLAGAAPGSRSDAVQALETIEQLVVHTTTAAKVRTTMTTCGQLYDTYGCVGKSRFPSGTQTVPSTCCKGILIHGLSKYPFQELTGWHCGVCHVLEPASPCLSVCPPRLSPVHLPAQLAELTCPTPMLLVS